MDINGIISESRDHLSILRLADSNCITYYVGDNPEHVQHLKDCTLICHPHFIVDLEGVDLFHCENPQLTFYQLSSAFKQNYLDYSAMELRDGAHIHLDAIVPDSCTVGPGCIIGACSIGDNVRIEANCTIYAKSKIGSRVVIEPNTVIGATGVMWVWNRSEKVFLEQLGNVRIEDDCFIGSNISIVRGSANETTVIGKGTCMAHGTMIGHGCQIGRNNHFANNVSLGGNVITGDNCFFGSGSVVPPGKNLTDETIVGAGAVITKNTLKAGIYAGVPAVRVDDLRETISGIPKWKVETD